MAGASVTWLGQASFRLDLGGTVLLVDPWFSPHEARLIEPPPAELCAGADGVLVTHEHLDHLDLPFLPTLSELAPDAALVLPHCLAHFVAPWFERVHGVLPGATVEIAAVTVEVVPATHGVTMADAYGDGSSLGEGPRFVGFVCRGAGVSIYHSGDTIASPALVSALAGRDVDVAMLPVNGRDAERERAGIVGNLDAAEAVELALGAGARTLIPCHWDGFAGNTADPATTVKAAAGRLDVVVATRNEPVPVARTEARALGTSKPPTRWSRRRRRP